MSSVAHGARLPVVRPPLPSWRAALTAVFMGWFFAFIAVAVVGLAASQVGLIERPHGGGLRDLPYPEAGRASFVANAVVWLWILALTALLIRGLLADRAPRPVSAFAIFVILAFSGFAPLLPRGLLDLPWLVALLATAALLRLAPAFSPPTIPKRATAVFLAAGALLLAVPALHAVRHPLWLGSSVFSDPPERQTATISLRNAGFADVELEAVSLRMLPPFELLPVELVDVRVDKHPPLAPGGPFESPRLPFTLGGRSEAFVQLHLRRMGCGSGPLKSEATVRYRVRGDLRVEALPVSITLRACS